MDKKDSFLEDFSDAAAINAISDLDTTSTLRERKSFATLAAHFAMLGFELIKCDPIVDGQAPFNVAHWEAGVQPLASLDAAKAYLIQMVGAGHVAR